MVVNHIGTVELGEVVPPRRVARLQFHHRVGTDVEFPGNGLQNLLVEQFHAEPFGYLRPYLMSASAELAVDCNDKFLVSVHNIKVLCYICCEDSKKGWNVQILSGFLGKLFFMPWCMLSYLS